MIGPLNAPASRIGPPKLQHEMQPEIIHGYNSMMSIGDLEISGELSVSLGDLSLSLGDVLDAPQYDRCVRHVPLTGGYPEQWVLDAASQIKDDMICVICSEIMCEPSIVGLCGHTYCLGCIAPLVVTLCPRTREYIFRYAPCPLCRSRLNYSSLHPSERLISTISALRCQCPECMFLGSPASIRQHINVGIHMSPMMMMPYFPTILTRQHHQHQQQRHNDNEAPSKHVVVGTATTSSAPLGAKGIGARSPPPFHLPYLMRAPTNSNRHPILKSFKEIATIALTGGYVQISGDGGSGGSYIWLNYSSLQDFIETTPHQPPPSHISKTSLPASPSTTSQQTS